MTLRALLAGRWPLHEGRRRFAMPGRRAGTRSAIRDCGSPPRRAKVTSWLLSVKVVSTGRCVRSSSSVELKSGADLGEESPAVELYRNGPRRRGRNALDQRGGLLAAKLPVVESPVSQADDFPRTRHRVDRHAVGVVGKQKRAVVSGGDHRGGRKARSARSSRSSVFPPRPKRRLPRRSG